MKLCFHAMVLLLVGCFSHGNYGYAEEEGAPIFDPSPNSQPVESDSELESDRRTPRVTTRLSDDAVVEEEREKESGFKWPSLPKPKFPTLPKLSLPSWTTAREMPKERMRPSDEPSTWEKFSSGTKNVMTKTKHTLMPWTQDEPATTTRRPTQPPRRTPPKTASRSKPSSTSGEKKSLFPWLSKKEEEEPVKTVNDFLSQPRIQ